MDFVFLADDREKLKERENRDKFLDLARELKRTMEHEGDGNTSGNWGALNNPKRIGRGTGRLGNKRTSGNHPDYRIIDIGQNTEKSPSDLRRLVTQTPVKDHQLTLA